MQIFTIKEALSFGWKKTSEHFAFAIFTTLCFMVAGAVLNGLAHDHSLGMLFKLANIIVTYFGTLTGVRMGLKVYRGEKPTAHDIFKVDWNFFATYIIASFLFVLGTGIGFMLLIVPGIIFAIRFGMFRFILVDENTKIMDSFKKSLVLTRGHFAQIFWFYFVVVLVNILGAIALGVGLLFTIPLSILSSVYVYEKLKLHEANPAN